MNAITKALTTAATLALGITMLAGCSQNQSQITWQDNGTPYAQHQHQQWWNYQYIYYPASQVYFEPFSEQYYWFQNGLWRQGTELPHHITLQFENPVIVKLDTDKPYMKHNFTTKAFAASFSPIEGSNLASSPQTFAAYMDRYELASNSSQQWAQDNASDQTPYASDFRPFTSPVRYNASADEFITNDDYVNGSDQHDESLPQILEQSTAEALSDQPDS